MCFAGSFPPARFEFARRWQGFIDIQIGPTDMLFANTILLNSKHHWRPTGYLSLIIHAVGSFEFFPPRVSHIHRFVCVGRRCRH
jgi:hypothetical protein